jgi:hypothetical protein
MFMKKKRFIKLKDPRLIKARTELRTLLSLVWDRQVSDLYDQIKEIDQDSSLDLPSKIRKQDQFRREIATLRCIYHQSPIGCRVCGNRERDLAYVPTLNTWYCEPCYLFNQDYYKRHPEEADWKALYP